MKKKLLSFCLLTALSATVGHAQTTAEIGCLKYQLNADDQTATVTDLVSLPEDSIVRIPETVTQGNVTYTVVEIGNRAFQGSTFNQTDRETLLQVKRITIAKTVRRIGESAFSIPGNINGGAYNTCALRAITFDEGSQLQELGKQAFGTTCLNEIDLPEGLKVIGEEVFYNSRYLKRVGLPSTLDSIGPRAFAGSAQVLADITLNEGIRAIADEAFNSNRVLKKIVLPASLQTIGKQAFNMVDTVVPRGATPPAIEANTFSSGVTVNVSVDVIDAYRAAPHWSNLNITAGSFTDEQGRKFNIISKEAVCLVSFKSNYGMGLSVTIPETETVTHEGNTFTVTEYAPQAFTAVSELRVEKQYTQLPAWNLSNLLTLYLPPSIKDMTLPNYPTKAAQIQLYLTSPTPPTINNVTPFTLWLDESLLEAYAAQSNAWWDVTELNPFESAGFKLTRLLSNLQGVTITSTPSGDITIPATINDSEGRSFNVVSVRAYNRDVTSVVIESAATAIGEREFAELPYLETVVLPEGITRIPANCFYASGITHIALPGSVTEIGQSAFQRTTKLKQITLPEGVTTLKIAAFLTSGIEKIHLPASFKNIEVHSLNALKLKEISVAEGNTTFCTVDGVLFSKDKKTLYFYPTGKEGKHYDIPEGTEQIAAVSFSNGILSSLRLPESFTAILQLPGRNYDYAFNDNGYKLNTVFQSKPDANQLNMFFGYYIPQTVILPVEYYCFADDDCSYATEDEAAQRESEWYQLTEEARQARIEAWESIKSQYNEIGVTNVMTENSFQARGAALTFAQTDHYAQNSYVRGYVVLSAVESLMGKHVVIPEVYNGLPVIGIESCAFAKCDKLESVQLPNTLKFIGEGAFFGCRNLKSVEGLENMEFTYLPSNDRSMNGVFNFAFADCPKLETLKWGGSAFNASMVIGNTMLKSVELPDTLLNMTTGDNLPLYTVNDGVVYMTQSFRVRIDNTYQTEFAPVLFYYPAGREDTEFTVPDGTREIYMDAMADSKIEKITLPASLKYIEPAAFYRNRNLTEVVMLSDSIEGLPIISKNVATPTTGYSNTYAFGQRYTFIGRFLQYNYSYYSPSMGYIYDEAYPAFETDWTSQNTVLYVKKRVFDELRQASHDYYDIFKEIRVLSEPTGINETTAQNRAQDGNAWYTLDGRRIEKPAQPGLYIHNGRKMVVK